jgi:ribosomal protein L37AE/L43A
MLFASTKKENRKAEGRFVSGGLELLFGIKKEGEKEGLWVGHSVFQLPVTVHRYRGGSEALVLSYLYERASSVSFFSEKPVVIELKVSQETIAERTKLSLWAVSQAINSLDADRCIRVERVRDNNGLVRLNVYLLLHSTTQEPLTCSPRIWGVCLQNADKPFITAPKELLKTLVQMQPSGRAVYLAALTLASVRISMSFTVTREEWKSETLVARNAFNRGVKECVKRGLVNYKRHRLTLHDPTTGRPSTKQRAERVRHAEADWKFKLDDITGEQWQRVAEKLLKREFTVGASGWSHTTSDSLCPFCNEPRSFTIHFANSQWKCHKCGERGRLFPLVQRVLRETQAQRVREYITQILEPEKQTEAPVLAGSVSDI